jgi:hypothetical protein
LTVDPASIVSEFEWFPARLDLERGAIRFVRLTRTDHRAIPFLYDDYIGPGRERLELSLDQIEAASASTPAGPCHFIFHSAFCCSTLLAAALDIEGRAMGLKEPYSLADLGVAATEAASVRGLDRQLCALLDLLARPFGDGEAVIVKPGNAANPMIDRILDLRRSSRALLIYSPLPDFLRSIAGKGLFGRTWARSLLAARLRLPEFDDGLDPAERWLLTDLQVAAMAWLQQHAQFGRLVHERSGRVATLDSRTLLSDPGAAVLALSSLFGLGLGEKEAAEIASGPVFARNSKHEGKAFSAAERADQHARVELAHGEEISMVVRWAEAVAAHAGVKLAPGAALLP